MPSRQDVHVGKQSKRVGGGEVDIGGRGRSLIGPEPRR